jgi:hypothetical protein
LAEIHVVNAPAVNGARMSDEPKPPAKSLAEAVRELDAVRNAAETLAAFLARVDPVTLVELQQSEFEIVHNLYMTPIQIHRSETLRAIIAAALEEKTAIAEPEPDDARVAAAAWAMRIRAAKAYPELSPEALADRLEHSLYETDFEQRAAHKAADDIRAGVRPTAG